MGRLIPGWSIVILVAGAACARPEAPTAGDETAEAGENNVVLAAALVGLPTATTAGELPDSASQGAQFVVMFCAQACHGLPAPSSHGATDWPVVLRRMWLRMERLDTAYHIAVPTTAERAVLQEYVIANALRVSPGNLPDAPGRDLYVERCGACHALPDVRQHSPQDWVTVVRRMNGRMERLIGRVLSQDEMQRIVLYLERASAGS